MFDFPKLPSSFRVSVIQTSALFNICSISLLMFVTDDSVGSEYLESENITIGFIHPIIRIAQIKKITSK